MPRNVRPSWIDVNSDSRAATIGAGPVARDGQLTATVSVRQDGDVLRLLDIDCIGSQDKQTVLVRVTDKRTGAAIFEEVFTQ